MKYDIAIIGAGPAGYSAALRAGQIGFKTVLIEKQHIGGMCLNWGCIPVKSLLESGRFFKKLGTASDFGIEGIDSAKLKFNWEKAVDRSNAVVEKLVKGINSQLKKFNIDIIEGEAAITGNNTISVHNRFIQADHIIIATGSIPGIIEDKDIAKKAVSIQELLSYKSLPESVVLYGSGGLIIEIAQLLNQIGKKVTILATDREIIPGIDKNPANYILRKLKKDGVSFKYYPDGAQEIKKNALVVNCSWRKGIIPHSEVTLETKNGYLLTDDNLQSSVDNIYAIGDVNGKSYLAHFASAQGKFVIDRIKGIKKNISASDFPLNLYTIPEIAQIGKTSEELTEQNIDFSETIVGMQSNGKALAEGSSEGFIRILHEKKYGEVLGVQIVSDNATDLISEATAFLSVEATVFDVAGAVHSHPTISEIFDQAGIMASFGFDDNQ